MRNEILQLKDLGRMPNESINDSDSIDELINAYDTLLEQIQFPISFDEAMVLVQIFPENAFYDLQWSLLRLVESVCVDDDRYIQYTYLQLIIPQYFISNKSGIWSLSLIVHSKG